MRTDQRYTRVRAMLLDEAVPRLPSGGIALCHLCQRSVYFADGFLSLLLRQLEQTIKSARPGCCPKCGSSRMYFIQRYERQRCADCRHEESATNGTPWKYGKKPREWYARVIALREAGNNPRQIAKLMGCYDPKPIYEFFARLNACKTIGAVA